MELLTRPSTFSLDEPTSGLDPATSAEVVRLLRRLTGNGVTVVLTTHEPATVDRCDRVVVLARDGHLAFTGTPAEARGYFGVVDLTEVYDLLATQGTPRGWAGGGRPDRSRRRPRAGRADATRRSAVASMRPPRTRLPPVGASGGRGLARVVFWVAFAGFFFGLTYGLLQIVGEMPVFRREQRSGLSVGAYVASKIGVLLPVLAAVTAVLLGVLRGPPPPLRDRRGRTAVTGRPRSSPPEGP